MNRQRRSVLHGLAVLPTSALLSRTDPRAATLSFATAASWQALGLARPGAVIELAAGEFGGVAQFEIGVPQVTLRSLTPLSAVLRAPVVVTAGGATLADLAFHGEGDDGVLPLGPCRLQRLVDPRGAGRGGEGCDFGYFPKRAILVRPPACAPTSMTARFMTM